MLYVSQGGCGVVGCIADSWSSDPGSSLSDVENFHYASQGPALDWYSSGVYQPLKKGVPLRLFGI